MDKLLRVGDLAKAVKKTVRAIHLYEEMGLIQPASRSNGGYRLYTDEAIHRVRWIQKLQDMGFSLTDVQGFVREWEGAGSGPDGMVRVRRVFEEKLHDTREMVGKLQALAKDLEESLVYLAACGTCETSHVKDDCHCCDNHGHDPARQPDLVAGLALEGRALKRIDVPVDHLKEGIR